MAIIVLEEELLAPPGFRWCASLEDSDHPVGLGDSRCQAVAALVAQLGMPVLLDLVWWATAHGENTAWLPLLKTEIEARQ